MVISGNKKERRDDFMTLMDFVEQLDFLRDNYDNVLQITEQQKLDIQRLIALLVERRIPIPRDIIDRYIIRASGIDTDSLEELPFK